MKSKKLKVEEQELLELIKTEANVKKIVFDKSQEKEIELDAILTPVLKQEGNLREIVRHIQDLRKKAGLTPLDGAFVYYFGAQSLIKIVKEKEKEILKTTKSTKLIERSPQGLAQKLSSSKQAIVDGESFWLGIVKD